MTDHQERAGQVDDEIADLERGSERLKGQIDETRGDWERKKTDDKVPGAEAGSGSADEEPPTEGESES